MSQFLLLRDPLTDRWKAWFTQVHSLQVELAQSKTSNTEKARRIRRMQNKSYVKHQHVPVVRPVWKLVFLLVMKILEGARALVSSSLDQLLQAFLGRGHLCPWLCLKCHLPSGCICSRLVQSLTRPKKRGRLSQVHK